MAQIEYNLYRAKMIRPKQGVLFCVNDTSEKLFLRALQERPSIEMRRNYIWHIGNISMLTESQGYFSIGRTTLTTLAQFDDQSGDFIDVPGENSPYTQVIFDSSIGVLAISKKPLLAPTTKGLASALERLLQSTKIVFENEIDVEISIIPDPTNFLEHVYAAFAVKKFSATFTGPNPFDADEYFQKPLSVYAKAADASGGKTTIAGEELNKDVVVSVAKSTAATGNKASARIQEKQGETCITVNMLGDPVKMIYEEEDHDVKIVLRDMLDKYRRVRG